MQRIYRVESLIDGKGMFTSSNSHDLNYSFHQKFNSLPLGWQDDIDRERDGREWFFGFTSLKELLSWIDFSDLAMLINLDFSIKVIKVCPICTQIGKSKKQIVYLKEAIVKEINITDRLYSILDKEYYQNYA